MPIFNAQIVVSNYLDVANKEPTNPVNGQKWMEDTTMKTWDESLGKWVEEELKGENGKTAYVYNAWANDLNGKDFTINKNQAPGKLYIGTYSSFNEVQSTDYRDYAWVETANVFNKELADIQESINNVKEITHSIKPPPEPKKGDLWWQLAPSGNNKVIAFNEWNGSKWTPSTIAQEVLNILELNAVNITGSVITGSSVVSFFNDVDIGGIGQHVLKRVKASGTATMSVGKFRIEFAVTDDAGVPEYKNSYGYVEAGVTGFHARWAKSNGHNLAVVQLGLNAQLTSYSTGPDGNYVGGTLDPRDLQEVPETPFSANMYTTGFTEYSAAANRQPRYNRKSRMVQLTGVIRNNVVIPANTFVTMAQLPVGVRPLREVTLISQGSGINRFALTVKTNGEIELGRYGTNNYAEVAVGSYLSIACVYSAAD